MSASVNDNFSKAEGNFSTTLSSGISSGASTIPLSSTTGLPTDTKVIISIFEADANGDPVAGTLDIKQGTVSGSNVINASTVEGTDQAHSAGDTVAMYFTETHWNEAVDAILTHSNQDGTLKDDSVDSAQIADGAVDLVHMSANSVDSDQYVDGSIDTAHLADDAVTPVKRTGGFYSTLWDATALGTGTGKTITGIGFTPKALIVLGTAVSSGAGVHAATGHCFYNGSTYIQGHHAAAGTTSAMRTITSTTQAFGSTSQAATKFVGAVTGFSDDTITVNITTNAADDYCKFMIMVLG